MKIEITTGSRLHFGLLCGTAETGWQFGGVGMMLRNPAWRISMTSRSSGDDQIAAGAEASTRVREFLRQIRVTRALPAADVVITEEVPFHTGLGGGTQLGLALACAAELLTSGRAIHDPYQLAETAQRAERSAVGTVGFREGGFLVDHGLAVAPGQKRRVERYSIPEDWRFVFVRPEKAQGLSGEQERSFFSRRVYMPRALLSQLTSHIEEQLVPSLQQHQFAQFAAALETYGDSVGSFYAAEQGDVFAHPTIRKLVQKLRVNDISGAAQSSWGPGICIPCHSVTHAFEITERIPSAIDGIPLAVTISEPMNAGVSLKTTSPESGSTAWA